MKKHYEMIFYISIAAGMALGTSSFMMVSGLFELTYSLWVVLAVALAGGICIVISSSVAELASMFPSSPGIRTYLKFAFGERVSLLLVFLYLIFMVLIAGVESYVFAQVVQAIFPALPSLGIVLVLLVTVITVNILGLELPRGLQILTAVILITAIFVLGATGLAVSPASLGEVFYFEMADAEALGQLPAAVGLAIFLYIGFEWVTPLGFGPESYKKRIPRSMPIAILINMVTYSFLVLGMSALLQRSTLVGNSVPQVVYFMEVIGPAGIYVAGFLSVLAIFSTFNAGVLGGSRLIFLLAREGHLPAWCGKISLTRGTPVGSILTLGGLAIISAIVVVSFELELVAAIIGTAIVCFVYAAFLLAVPRLKKLRSDAPRPYHTHAPRWMQWLLIAAMPVIGFQALISTPTLTPLLAALGFVALGYVLTLDAEARVRRNTAARKASEDKTKELFQVNG